MNNWAFIKIIFYTISGNWIMDNLSNRGRFLAGLLKVFCFIGGSLPIRFNFCNTSIGNKWFLKGIVFHIHCYSSAARQAMKTTIITRVVWALLETVRMRFIVVTNIRTKIGDHRSCWTTHPVILQNNS